MNKTIITDVAKYEKGWVGGRPETECGHGSRLSQTVVQRRWIPQMVKKHNIVTVADIGAGDLNWIQEMTWQSPVQYEAYDLVPRHPSVKKFDLLHEVPPRRDLLMCLWVLNHFPVEQAKVAQDNLFASGSDYLMLTWWEEMDDYLDVPAIEEVCIRSWTTREGRSVDYWLRLVKC